jgi:S1-C subfamily serine protease
VIVSIDASEIHSGNDLMRALELYKVGDTVDVVVQNSGQRRTVKVTLQSVQ